MICWPVTWLGGGADSGASADTMPHSANVRKSSLTVPVSFENRMAAFLGVESESRAATSLDGCRVVCIRAQRLSASLPRDGLVFKNAKRCVSYREI